MDQISGDINWGKLNTGISEVNHAARSVRKDSLHVIDSTISELKGALKQPGMDKNAIQKEIRGLRFLREGILQERVNSGEYADILTSVVTGRVADAFSRSGVALKPSLQVQIVELKHGPARLATLFKDVSQQLDAAALKTRTLFEANRQGLAQSGGHAKKIEQIAQRMFGGQVAAETISLKALHERAHDLKKLNSEVEAALARPSHKPSKNTHRMERQVKEALQKVGAEQLQIVDAKVQQFLEEAQDRLANPEIDLKRRQRDLVIADYQRLDQLQFWLESGGKQTALEEIEKARQQVIEPFRATVGFLGSRIFDLEDRLSKETDDRIREHLSAEKKQLETRFGQVESHWRTYDDMAQLVRDKGGGGPALVMLKKAKQVRLNQCRDLNESLKEADLIRELEDTRQAYWTHHAERSLLDLTNKQAAREWISNLKVVADRYRGVLQHHDFVK